MRNRGIELFILNENDSLDQSNDIDLKSLIHANGITENVIANCLIKLHEFISDLILGKCLCVCLSKENYYYHVFQEKSQV